MAGFASWFASNFNNFLSQLAAILVEVFHAIVAILLLPLEGLKQLLLAAFPGISTSLASFVHILEYVQMWVDLNAIIPMVMAYLYFLSIRASYRFIKSWIPTVSG